MEGWLGCKGKGVVGGNGGYLVVERMAALPLGETLGEGSFATVAVLNIPAAPPMVAKLLKLQQQSDDLPQMALAEADSLHRVAGIEGVPGV